MKNIYLIVGRSGSGKNSVVDGLSVRYHHTAIQSFTTRPQRYEGETGHIFCTKEQFDAMDREMVAYVHYNGYDYCATRAQVEVNDLYVIDPEGVSYFKRHYRGKKGVKVIHIKTNRWACAKNMRDRGGSESDIKRRIFLDNKWFSDIKADFSVHNRRGHLGRCVEQIQNYIEQCEAES